MIDQKTVTKMRKCIKKIFEARDIRVLDDNIGGCFVIEDDGELALVNVVFIEANKYNDNDGHLSVEEFDEYIGEFFANPKVDISDIKFAPIRHDVIEARIFEGNRSLVKHVRDIPIR